MKTTSHIRWIANTLRVLALFLFLLAAGACSSKAWMDSLLVSYGLGQVPDSAPVQYVQLLAGYLAASLAIMLWIATSDVLRYRPFVVATTVIYLVGAPAFYWISAVAGMPRWCGILDSVCCLLGGGILLTLLMWPPMLSFNQGAAENRRPAGPSDGSDNLSATLLHSGVPLGGGR